MNPSRGPGGFLRAGGIVAVRTGRNKRRGSRDGVKGRSPAERSLLVGFSSRSQPLDNPLGPNGRIDPDDRPNRAVAGGETAYPGSLLGALLRSLTQELPGSA